MLNYQRVLPIVIRKILVVKTHPVFRDQFDRLHVVVPGCSKISLPSGSSHQLSSRPLLSLLNSEKSPFRHHSFGLRISKTLQHTVSVASGSSWVLGLQWTIHGTNMWPPRSPRSHGLCSPGARQIGGPFFAAPFSHNWGPSWNIDWIGFVGKIYRKP
jgi:hypothetical protein